MIAPAGTTPPADHVKSSAKLTARVLTSVVLIPVVVAAAWAGGVWFALLAGAVVALGGHEWVRLCAIERPMPIALLLAVGPVLAIALTSGGPAAGMVVLVAALVSALGGPRGAARLWPFVGVAYLGLPLVALLALRASPQFGFEGLIFLFAMVWLTDIGAYAFGRLIGGPRLAPAISPGKTWAGAAGGLLLAVAGAYGGADWLANPLPLGAVALAICLSLATQCGDLFESWVKRRFGKKDSGTIIPGHGGILDRIDGLLFAAPVMAAIMIAQRGAEPLWP